MGAAVLAQSGEIYCGVNIENASFGATNCAERTAIFTAISAGEQKIKAIAISGDSTGIIYPCGICRQVIAEFASEGTKVICGGNNNEFRVFKLKDLLPNAFLKDTIE